MELFLHILCIILFIPVTIDYVSGMKKTTEKEKREIQLKTFVFACVCQMILFNILSIIGIFCRYIFNMI